MEGFNDKGDQLASPDWGATLDWAGNPLVVLCLPGGTNCYPPIDIYPSALEPLDDAIDNGADGVKEFFDDDEVWLDLFPDQLSKMDHLIDLQSGNFTMSKLVDGDKVMYVATDGDDEFAFQFTTL